MSLLQTLAFLLLVAFPTAVWADLRVNATRVVHQEGSKTTTSIRIQNVGTQPSLIQAWIDDGDEGTSLEELRPPLFVTPPVFRLNAGGKRDIQIRAADTLQLPRDRESLLWLNILDAQARASGRPAESLEFAMRWRLKVFHRPAGLPGSADAAATTLQWSLQTDARGQTLLKATNSTPYFASLSEVILGGQAIALDASTAQVPPMGQWTHALPTASAPDQPTVPLKITWVDALGIERQLDTRAVRED
ncbi:fimbrial biogenesis chaperone [Stenotrophomonas maltophilia]|uniref:fimbrial biogenesis chaperone n=1 Tax=Stenotrophomonas maltophilia TaxID=40324 RepID=UPI00021E0B12|nr:fimbria/pilus periplasmic chaperone [Stenotrophomonas maltophilia]AEM51474.1 Pili assembly chaperone [Stenotrophomonas maltophilia JV3]